MGQRRSSSASELADMVNVLESIGRALRSGAGLHGALRGSVASAGVHREDLEGVVAQLDSGVTLVEALGAWRRRRPRPAVALATAVLTFGVHSGGSVARGVDAAAATLRERLALQGEVRVLAAQARSSAAVVALAPLAFTVVVVMADGRAAGFLFTTVGGLVCLVVGVALEVACVRWMRALTAAAGVL